MVNGSVVVLRRDSVAVEFDEERLIANAGLLLTSTLSDRLGLERLVEETVDLGERPGAARPGRKVLSLAHAFAAGADSIDDRDPRAPHPHSTAMDAPPARPLAPAAKLQRG